MALSLKYYQLLPLGMEPDDVRDEFDKFFSEIHSSFDSIDTMLVADCLSELASRQWDTYEIIDDSRRQQVVSLVKTLWDGHNLEMAELLLFVIAHIGLSEALDFIKQQPEDMLSPEVLAEVRDTIEGLGDTVDDPYSNLK